MVLVVTVLVVAVVTATVTAYAQRSVDLVQRFVGFFLTCNMVQMTPEKVPADLVDIR